MTASDLSVRITLPLTEVEAFVAETARLIEAVTFDESGRLIGQQWVGGNGGLISRDTLKAADLLRQRLESIAAMVAAGGICGCEAGLPMGAQ